MILVDERQMSLPGVPAGVQRWCSACSSWLPLDAFYPAYRRRHGHCLTGGSGYCRACHRTEGRRRR